jgi:hypothetical protein
MECAHCGLDPSTDPTLAAKSAFLSIGRYESPEAMDAYHKELQIIADRVKKGETIDFPQDEIERLLRQKLEIESIPRWRPYLALSYAFWPILAFFAVAGAIYAVLCWIDRLR